MTDCRALANFLAFAVATGALIYVALAPHENESAASNKPKKKTKQEVGGGKDMRWFWKQVDLSFLRELAPDPETATHAPNKTMREVMSGHYVLVKPSALPTPYLVAVSPNLAATLGLSAEACASPEFLRFFSGGEMEETVPGLESWCTPYAVSIFGAEVVDPCPFKTGNGYGDGRAISIAEVKLGETTGKRWELQLKGAGTTVFCRGADGRAVLRSSLREFVASEAMFALGVSTTRALSLIASSSLTVDRPWYSGKTKSPSHQLPTLDSPELAYLPLPLRKSILRGLQQRARQPDVVRPERAVVTCRAAPSFIRVGHLELFARRVRAARSRLHDSAGPQLFVPAISVAEASRHLEWRMQELRQLLEHLLQREYPEIAYLEKNNVSLEERLLAMAQCFSQRLATLTADWIRVGFCQGNFNSDNCLAGARTMDYGPFGFVERFDPDWNMWVSGGDHYGFLRQPTAGLKNFSSYCSALEEVLSSPQQQVQLKQIEENHKQLATSALELVWARKLGLALAPPLSICSSDTHQGGKQAVVPEVASLVPPLLQLMEESQADYTLFWRQLAAVAMLPSTAKKEALLSPLRNCVFYTKILPPLATRWIVWLEQWRSRIAPADREGAAASMRRVSPKYVAREWMLVDAYVAAEKGQLDPLQELQELLQFPYDELTPELERKYYQRAPPKIYTGCGEPGVAFMSCSS
eukprot:gb/GEZN01002482.1/.p1 GENE.gb/GEZN01002482.1/~~gb/GEZN01002482.1/.p1  ORF type:complete len:697 (+),score=101.93 gb/GEZN01002482.1/:216-2306(+)